MENIIGHTLSSPGSKIQTKINYGTKNAKSTASFTHALVEKY